MDTDPVLWQPELSVADHYVYGKFTIGVTLWEVRWRSLADGEDLMVSPLSPCCGSAITSGDNVGRKQRLFACGANCDQAMPVVRMSEEIRWLSYTVPAQPNREGFAAWVEQAYGLNTLEEEVLWSTLTSWDWSYEQNRAREAAGRVLHLRGLAVRSASV